VVRLRQPSKIAKQINSSARRQFATEQLNSIRLALRKSAGQP